MYINKTMAKVIKEFINKSMKYYCPYCHREIKPEEETEMGVFCCGHDFWLSECETD